MNWAELLAPRYHLARYPDGTLLQTGQDAWEQRVLGFDCQTARFVTIHTLLPRSQLPQPLCLSVGERVYLAGRIAYPGLFNVTDYGERRGCLFYVTELEEGEALPSYLARLRSLPLSVALDLAVQLAALLRHLASYPRILGNVSSADLFVAPSLGQSLSLRLAGLGLNRQERDLAPKELEKFWLPQTADLLWNLAGVALEGDHQLKFSSQGSAVLLDPFRSFLQAIRVPPNCPTTQAFRELERDLHHHLHRFVEILDPHRRFPCPEECISLRPHSFLSHLLIEEGVLPQWQDHNFEFAPELFSSQSRFALTARDIRTSGDIALQVLPPSSLIGESGLESHFRKLGHPGLKDGGQFLRTFFLRSEGAYTVFAEESLHGFNLVNLLERRAVLFSNEVHAILTSLAPVFQQLECATGIEDLVVPWNVCMDFAPAIAEDQVTLCLNSWRLRNWPPFQLKVRIGPTMVDFTRPVRSEWEEILRQLNADHRSHPQSRHHLDLSFAALAVFLLEYRRYHNLLASGDPHPRAAVSCGRFRDLLHSTLLSNQPRTPDVRERFLDGMANRLDKFAYPCEAVPSPVPAADPILDASSGPSSLSSTAQAIRQRKVAFLNRLLRRDSSRMRMRKGKSAS